MEHMEQENSREKRLPRSRFDPKISIKSLIIACAVCIALTAGIACLMVFSRLGGVTNYKLALKYADVKKVVDTYYIGDSSNSAISDAASAAMITALNDKWSYYMTPEEYQSYQMYSANEYAGIGVTIQLDEKTKGFQIMSITAQSPAEQAGLAIGDIITAVDGESVSGKTLSEVQSLIRSKLNETLKFTIQNADGDSRTVNVDCTTIYTDPVNYKMLENNVGYVKINNFETGAGTSAVQAVDQLLDNGAVSIVFDVRGNPGGMLSELITILDHLLPEGDVFVSVDKSGSEDVTRSDNVCVKVPMAVLVNGSSYSAAEYFAAALREYNWATIVGENTTGKGRSQTTIELDDGSAVHISSRKYLTPNRVDLSEQGGLTPDVVISPAVEGDVDTQLEAAIRVLG